MQSSTFFFIIMKCLIGVEFFFLHFILSIPLYVHDSERFHGKRKKKEGGKEGNGMWNRKKRVIQGMRFVKRTNLSDCGMPDCTQGVGKEITPPT